MVLFYYADTCKICCSTGNSVRVKTSWVSGNTDIFMPI